MGKIIRERERAEKRARKQEKKDEKKAAALAEREPEAGDGMPLVTEVDDETSTSAEQ
jgi:hypothetical protein